MKDHALAKRSCISVERPLVLGVGPIEAEGQSKGAGLKTYVTTKRKGAASMATAAQEMHESLTTPFLIFTERNRAVMEKMARVTHEEALRVLNRNLERNVRALERLRDCHGVSGVVQIQNDWLTGVVRDSIDQTQRMVELWWRLADEEGESHAEAASQTMSARSERKPERGHTVHNPEQKRAA